MFKRKHRSGADRFARPRKAILCVIPGNGIGRFRQGCAYPGSGTINGISSASGLGRLDPITDPWEVDDNVTQPFIMP